jgi:hypothetical protein
VWLPVNPASTGIPPRGVGGVGVWLLLCGRFVIKLCDLVRASSGRNGLIWRLPGIYRPGSAAPPKKSVFFLRMFPAGFCCYPPRKAAQPVFRYCAGPARGEKIPFKKLFLFRRDSKRVPAAGIIFAKGCFRCC